MINEDGVEVFCPAPGTVGRVVQEEFTRLESLVERKVNDLEKKVLDEMRAMHSRSETTLERQLASSVLMKADIEAIKSISHGLLQQGRGESRRPLNSREVQRLQVQQQVETFIGYTKFYSVGSAVVPRLAVGTCENSLAIEDIY